MSHNPLDLSEKPCLLNRPFDSPMNPLIQALQQLGGSGSIDEIYEKVVEIENISEDVMAKRCMAQRKVTRLKWPIDWGLYTIVPNTDRITRGFGAA